MCTPIQPKHRPIDRPTAQRIVVVPLRAIGLLVCYGTQERFVWWGNATKLASRFSTQLMCVVVYRWIERDRNVHQSTTIARILIAAPTYIIITTWYISNNRGGWSTEFAAAGTGSTGGVEVQISDGGGGHTQRIQTFRWTCLSEFAFDTESLVLWWWIFTRFTSDLSGTLMIARMGRKTLRIGIGAGFLSQLVADVWRFVCVSVYTTMRRTYV